MGKRCTRETSYAKKFATEASFSAANEAIQIHGAYGFSDEYDVERYLRNSKGAMIYEGSSEIQTLIQAGYALGERSDKPLRCELPAYDERLIGKDKKFNHEGHKVTQRFNAFSFVHLSALSPAVFQGRGDKRN